MDVLEKILEEIERTRKSIIDMSDEEPELVDVEDWFDEGVDQGKLIAYEVVKEIIRSHMDEAKDTNAISNDKIIEDDGIDSVSKEFLKDCAEVAERYKKSDSNWIPIEEKLPEDDRYILLSFENFSLPLVGRYEENEKGGAFYLGDCDEEDTCISNDLYVNAWMYLPERYKGDSNA